MGKFVAALSTIGGMFIVGVVGVVKISENVIGNYVTTGSEEIYYNSKEIYYNDYDNDCLDMCYDDIYDYNDWN